MSTQTIVQGKNSCYASGNAGPFHPTYLSGIMFSSYAWGLCGDTMGRRTTLLMAMPIGCVFNVLASFAPTYASLASLKFLSASFSSSANAVAFVLAAESVPQRHRSRFMHIMASVTMFVQLYTALFALPIFRLTFQISIPWLALEYRPWRLLLLIISAPGIIGTISILFLHESPKYLLSKHHDDEAVNILKSMYSYNTGLKMASYPIPAVHLDETYSVPASVHSDTSFLRKIWNQTAPLFRPPLLKNSLKLYYILLTAYMTSTGYTMWIPTMINAYFDDQDKSGQTFCQVVSTAATAVSNNSTSTDCDNVVKPLTLYAVMVQSGVAGCVTILLSFIVDFSGKRCMTLVVFTVSALCGVVLLFATVPLLSIAMFYLFLYVALILGNANTYLVELNPTHLRGMATCLSVVVARGFGFFSVQIIAHLLADHCTPMISGYIGLVISGFVVSVFLPPDTKKIKESCCQDGTVESVEQAKSRF